MKAIPFRNTRILALTLAILACSGSVLAAESPKEGASFKIGLIYPKSGPLAPYAQSLANAVRLGLDEFRRDKPELGEKVAVVVADDKSLATEAVKAGERLIQTQSISVLVGSLSNTANNDLIPLLEAKKIPLLLPKGFDEDLLEKSPIVFSMTPTDRWQGRMLGFFARSIGKTRALIVGDKRNPRSELIEAGFKEAFEKGGGSISASVDLEAVQAIKDALAQPVDSILFVGPSLKENAGAQELAKAKSDLLVTDMFKLDADISPTQTIYAFQNFSERDNHQGVQDFVKAYELKYKKKPDALAASAYEAIRVILHSFFLQSSVPDKSFLDILAKSPLGGIYGIGQFTQDRVFMRPTPFLILSKGGTQFKSRIQPQ